jgi:Spy/CpxP family protein refolding chaperone
MRQLKLAIAAVAALAALAGMSTGVSANQGGFGGPGGPGMGYGKGMRQCEKWSGHRMGPGARLDMMTAHLGLTAEQRYKILPILDDQAREMKAVWSDENLTRAQTRAKMLAIHDKCFDRIKGILTPEQQKKAAEMRAGFAEHWKQRQARMTQPCPMTQTPPAPQK